MTDTEKIMKLAAQVAEIETDDDLAPAYAAALALAVDLGAPVFAFDLAQRGMKAGSIYALAQEWHDDGAEPAAFVGVLSDFASKIRELV